MVVPGPLFWAAVCAIFQWLGIPVHLLLPASSEASVFAAVIVGGALLLSALLLLVNPVLKAFGSAALDVLVDRLTGGWWARRAGFIVDPSSDLTPEWLEGALCREQPGTVVKDLLFTTIGDDMGNASLMYKLSITFAENPHDIPQTLILKTPKASAKPDRRIKPLRKVG